MDVTPWISYCAHNAKVATGPPPFGIQAWRPHRQDTRPRSTYFIPDRSPASTPVQLVD